VTVSCLFVTGMQRSGTTLIEKLLGSHPRVSILSQPFPLVFIEAKRDFLRRTGAGDPAYPLGHLFREGRYRSADLASFLVGYRSDPAVLGALFDAMARYSGQYTRPDPAALAAALDALRPGDFFDTVGQLYRGLGAKPGAAVFGGKETICEEFLPYLLDRGAGCVLILRDPRDVLASMNHGRGPDFAGDLKPTLFNVRNWRKSVAFAIHLAGHRRLTWMRYEDLVARPLDCANRVASALGIDAFPEALLAGAIRDAAGAWGGNSSHGHHEGISAASVGAYRTLLAPEVVAYVEAACYPELRWLGYPCAVTWEEVPGVLRAFREPYDIPREGLAGYSEDPAHVAAELRRTELLGAPASETTRPYFLFDDVHEALRRAVREAPRRATDPPR
jgi:Sulfotransferase family